MTAARLPLPNQLPDAIVLQQKMAIVIWKAIGQGTLNAVNFLAADVWKETLELLF